MPSLDVPGPDKFTEVLDDRLKGRLPVLLRLRDFWEYLPARRGASLTASDLEDSIARWVEKRQPDGIDAGLFRAHLAHGSVLLIVDGVDEVPVGAMSAGGKWLRAWRLHAEVDELMSRWDWTGVSKSEVSRICGELDPLVEAFRTRALGTGYPYFVSLSHRVVIDTVAP